MFMNNKLVFAVLAAALAAHAQDSTSTAATSIPSNITQCTIGCITQSLSAGGCSGITDITCVCTSTAFQDAAAACLTASCTADDVAAAQALQDAQCGAVASGSSAASSASETASNAASSALSSVSSAASGAASSLSSAASGASRSLSSALSSATNPSSASVSATNTGNAAGALTVNMEGLFGLGVAVVGAIAGAGLVL